MKHFKTILVSILFFISTHYVSASIQESCLSKKLKTIVLYPENNQSTLEKLEQANQLSTAIRQTKIKKKTSTKDTKAQVSKILAVQKIIKNYKKEPKKVNLNIVNNVIKNKLVKIETNKLIIDNKHRFQKNNLLMLWKTDSDASSDEE